MNIEKKLLLGRLLTRSGDHAWDFAVPLALLHAFPGRLQIAAMFYLVTKLLMMLVTPRCGRWIDQTPRLKVLRFGIVLQLIAVICGGLFFTAVDSQVHNEVAVSAFAVFFGGLVLAGVMASLGSLITDISVGNDVVPALVASERLTQFNSWLRRVDLATEVISPIIAGLLFALSPSGFHLAGFFLIVLWNVISFFPEYFLLRGAIASIPASADKKGALVTASMTSFWSKLLQFDFKSLREQSLAPLLISYALLWLSALSPHGVLLTGYLKDQAQLPEFEIGVFRGLGALFGLFSTISFPFLVRKTGLLRSSHWHLGFQAAVLALGATVFFLPQIFSIHYFLAFVLLSRIGLYGFMNGEFELRQRLIPEESRGRVNSFSSVLTTLATLLLFGLGSLLTKTQDFRWLVLVSVAMVIAGFITFHFWSRQASDVSQT
jgi:iron-regulated transporter 1